MNDYEFLFSIQDPLRKLGFLISLKWDNLEICFHQYTLLENSSLLSEDAQVERRREDAVDKVDCGPNVLFTFPRKASLNSFD